MRSRLLAIVLWLMSSSHLALSQDFPLLTVDDLRAARIEKTDFYAGRGLFGYIDGGAELYLEYGFNKLERQEVLYLNERFIVEVYQMAGANGAYGVFSVQRFKCVPADSLLPNTCQSKYQLQAVAGDCYLNIINESGSQAAMKGSVDILRSLMSRIKPQSLQLPSLILDEKLRPDLRNLIIAYGPIGLQNGYSDWIPFFETFDAFTLMLVPIERGSEHLTVAYIQFPSGVGTEEFSRSAGFAEKLTSTLQTATKGNTRRFARQLGKQVLLFAEGSVSFPGLEEFIHILSR
jgi:hypothetical protein